MPDYAGPLQHLALSRTLWLVLVWPLLGAAWQLFLGRRRIANGVAQDESVVRGSAIASIALATTATLAHVAVLARQPPGQRALFEPLTDGGQVGQIDVILALWFDPLAAVGCVVACAIALAAILLAPQRLVREGGWRAWMWVHVSLCGALLSFLADGFVTTALGWSLATAAGAWLAGWTDRRAGLLFAMRGAVAIAAMLAGTALLFWGLGGVWEGDEFVPDVQPRFAAVRVGEWSGDNASQMPRSAGDDAREGKPGGAVTLTSAPGALVFVDEARRRSLDAPFVRVPVLGGSHGFRIHQSEGLDDAVVGSVAFEGGQEIALAPLGPVLSFRAVADQLALRDRHGEPVVRRTIETRRAPGGLTIVGGAFLAWLLAALSLSGGRASENAPRPLVAVASGATLAPLGPYFLARVTSFGPLEPRPGMPITALGFAILLFGAIRAMRPGGQASGPGTVHRRPDNLSRALSVVGVAPAAIGCFAVGGSGAGALLWALPAAGAATAGLELIASRRRAWYGTPEAGTRAAAHARRERSTQSVDELLLLDIPERLGTVFVSMERWVMSASVGIFAPLATATAWVAATADTHLVSKPADVAATRLVRVGRRIEPFVGVPLGWVLWALLGAGGLGALLHALWPAR